MNAGAAAPPSVRFIRSTVEQITILLVEDARLVREAAHQVLTAAGFRVLKARNAGEARKLYRRGNEHIQVLITDVVLSSGSGCELAREIAGDQPELKTIFMSGYPEFIAASANAGAASGGGEVHFLGKPFSRESLLAKVDEVLCEEATTVKPGAVAAYSG